MIDFAFVVSKLHYSKANILIVANPFHLVYQLLVQPFALDAPGLRKRFFFSE